MRYFHLYADGRTIREIDFAEYMKLSQRKIKNKRFQCAALGTDFVIFIDGDRVVTVTLRQLREVLEKAEK